jgi:hypothetical protein
MPGLGYLQVAQAFRPLRAEPDCAGFPPRSIGVIIRTFAQALIGSTLIIASAFVRPSTT